MSKKSFLMLLLLCHLIGDYYLQSEETAEKKITSWKYFIKHCVQYAIPFAAAAVLEFFVTGFDTSRAFWLCAGSHAGIDLIKKCYELWLEKKKSATDRDKKRIGSYLVDQILHFFCLIAVAYLCPMPFPDVPEKWAEMLSYLLYLMSLMKPANVTFKILFSEFQIKTEKPRDPIKEPKSGAGAWIGDLERLLSGILILLGQFSAVGLTMTAKSIARYDEIVKNPAFAEYYLIGTLYSILYTLVAYCVIFKILI